MTALAPSLASFLREHLPRERNASPHTVASYAHAFSLLLRYAANRLGRRPTDLTIEDLDPDLILGFLSYVEQDRGNTARSRNARFAAIRSFFRYLEYKVPACLEQALRVRSLPMKKTDKALEGEVVAIGKLEAASPGMVVSMDGKARSLAQPALLRVILFYLVFRVNRRTVVAGLLPAGPGTRRACRAAGGLVVDGGRQFVQGLLEGFLFLPDQVVILARQSLGKFLFGFVDPLHMIRRCFIANIL